MEDTVIAGDHVMVEKFAYGLRLPLIGTRLFRSEPCHGDVIIYRPPDRPSTMFLHRLVALPGDKVEVDGHRLILNDQPVDEPHVKIIEPPPASSSSRRGEYFGPVVVPEGMAFVLGDNRAASLDSRFTGFIPLSSVHGQARFIYWSRLARRSFARKAPSHPVRWERVGQSVE
jgi:signal peptidase I